MKKTISVYFSGTGFEITQRFFLANQLFEQTNESETQIKFGFNGCGVDYGLMGTIFGTGIDKQCQQVIERVEQEIAAGHTITLNVYGHSRGGIAALMLAKQLGKVDPELLEINLGLLDPVPGNLVTTSTLDFLKISLANKTGDLSDCRPLKRVLALYPHIPLPDIAFHAPLFPRYPEHTEVEEDATSGCHAEAEQVSSFAGAIASLRFMQFMRQCGTDLGTNSINFDERLKNIYDYQLSYLADFRSRSGHSADGKYIHINADAQSFNRHHQRLKGLPENPNTAAVSIRESDGFFARATRFVQEHWLLARSVKWAAIGTAVGLGLAATGGLGALPLLAAIPLIAVVGAAVWYGIFKPIALWCASKIHYPDYAMRDIKGPDEQAEEIQGSPGLMASRLGVDAQRTLDRSLGVELGRSEPLFSSRGQEPAKASEFGAFPAM